jgi:ADP-dependent NAD(P)H-hydrate dehydratase / NAD(P)H-hydrate epimerase
MRTSIEPGLSACAVLTPAQMGEADRLAAADHADGTFALMREAAFAVMDVVLARHAAASRIAILCGPGNNGGDGFMLAALLEARGVQPTVYAIGVAAAGSDAHRALAEWGGTARNFAAFDPAAHDLVVDAVFGAGLARNLDPALQNAIARTNGRGIPVVSVDLPTGIDGLTGQVRGAAFDATETITFFRKKPGHVLQPGRAYCGELIVAEIGIPAHVLGAIRPDVFENGPDLWLTHRPKAEAATHKFAKGAVAVVSGAALQTGAARLAGRAAARAGAGAVTFLSEAAAASVIAHHETAAMIALCESAADLSAFLGSGKTAALVIGPAAGVNERTAHLLHEATRPQYGAQGGRGLKGLVVDADALTMIAQKPGDMLAWIAQSGVPTVLTPHEGEFARLFPDLTDGSKLERTRSAAKRSGAVVLLKGPDTVIAAPDGRAAINTNGTVALATAGSGDVLAGIIAALLAQGMPAWEAACAGAWLHGEAGRVAGEGAGAEAIVAAVSLPPRL